MWCAHECEGFCWINISFSFEEGHLTLSLSMQCSCGRIQLHLSVLCWWNLLWWYLQHKHTEPCRAHCRLRLLQWSTILDCEKQVHVYSYVLILCLTCELSSIIDSVTTAHATLCTLVSVCYSDVLFPLQLGPVMGREWLYEDTAQWQQHVWHSYCC